MTRQPLWPEWLEQHIRRVTGPEDCPDTNVNGDPDATLGEEADDGFDEMATQVGWDDPDFDAEDEDDEGEAEGDGDEDG